MLPFQRCVRIPICFSNSSTVQRKWYSKRTHFKDVDTEDLKRRLFFDTSGLNELAKDPTGAMARAVVTAYSVEITGTNVAEVTAASDSTQRKDLLSVLKLLLAHGICLIPARWIVRRHAEQFLRDPDRHRWEQLDIRSRGAERALAADTLQETGNSRVVLAENAALEEQFNFLHKGERTRLDDLLQNRGSLSFAEYFATCLQDNGPGWNVGVSMFEKATTVRVDERSLRCFLQECPPWRAIFIAILWSHYRMCFIDPRGKGIKKAGRQDLMSAVYLPYCHVFVTRDEGQYGALSDIVQEAELSTDIWRYERLT